MCYKTVDTTPQHRYNRSSQPTEGNMAAKGKTMEVEADEISEDVVEHAAMMPKFSLFTEDMEFANAPTTVKILPKTEEGRRQAYIGFIDEQIAHLETIKSGKVPLTYNKDGKQVKARTWATKKGNRVFLKIRNGKGYLKFNGRDSIVFADETKAIEWLEAFKGTVLSGEAAMQLGLKY